METNKQTKKRPLNKTMCKNEESIKKKSLMLYYAIIQANSLLLTLVIVFGAKILFDESWC